MLRGIFWRLVLAAGAALLPFSAVHAAVIDYVVTPLGADNWRYDYTITNSSPSLGFDELTVYFDINKYDLLSSPVASAGWDPLLVQPDPGIPADGFYDVLKLSGLIAEGAKVSGFSVSFSYLVAGTPGSQPFDLLNSSSFTVMQSGGTVQMAAVPEAATCAMFLTGLAILSATLRRQRRPPS